MKGLSRRGSCVDKALRWKIKNCRFKNCKQVSAIGVWVTFWRLVKDRNHTVAMVGEQFSIGEGLDQICVLERSP